MKKFYESKPAFFLIGATIFFLLLTLSEKKICVIAEVEGKSEIITSADAGQKISLTINFIHSVQKTPVVEELESDGEDFILLRTKYQSHGVGLPFSETDGEFRREGNFFVIDKMNRRIKNLSLRTGTGTQLCITFNGEEFKLYEKYKPGTEIKFRVLPVYKILFG